MADDEQHDHEEHMEGPIEAEVPTEFGKSLRCCFSCRLVKTFRQFLEKGCENCPFLEMVGDYDSVQLFTTTSFSGMISVIEPDGSWAAKWTHVAKFAPGCYALALTSDIPHEVEEILENHNITWHKHGD